jgi:hypothetical protein
MMGLRHVFAEARSFLVHLGCVFMLSMCQYAAPFDSRCKPEEQENLQAEFFFFLIIELLQL